MFKYSIKNKTKGLYRRCFTYVLFRQNKTFIIIKLSIAFCAHYTKHLCLLWYDVVRTHNSKLYRSVRMLTTDQFRLSHHTLSLQPLGFVFYCSDQLFITRISCSPLGFVSHGSVPPSTTRISNSLFRFSFHRSVHPSTIRLSRLPLCFASIAQPSNLNHNYHYFNA